MTPEEFLSSAYVTQSWEKWRKRHGYRGVIAIGVYEQMELGWGSYQEDAYIAAGMKITEMGAGKKKPVTVAYLDLTSAKPAFEVAEILMY
jgi:hypothetical protein